MKTAPSEYLAGMKPVLKELLDKLLTKYKYASVLATDSIMKSYAVSGNGINISGRNNFDKRGFVIRAYDGEGWAEYAGNELSRETMNGVLYEIEHSFAALTHGARRLPAPLPEEEPISFFKSTDYLLHPQMLGDETIIDKLTQIRELAKKADDRILDASVGMNYQCCGKLFLSPGRDMEQNIMWSCASFVVLASRGEEIKEYFKGYSVLGGAEVLDKVESDVGAAVGTVIELLSSEPMIPGEYECICDPEVTGMIVHEAFGHGVEMDMFVKDRALARNFMGEYVASPLVTMKDGAASAREVASFFFDDEGNLAGDTTIIDKGVLVSGIADAVSASRLGIRPTGNGRRESVDRKAYTRMTNTFFTGGTDSVDDMIASVKYGMLLENPSSGMEDPKNWGIQCMVNFAREIKDGKLTGRIFSPVVLTGYVPDLLKSISMVSPSVELCGSGACGKGYKEWVKVSDGGPWIKARIRLG